MSRTIQIYVKSETKLTTESGLSPSVSGHPCAGKEPIVKQKKEHVLPEDCRRIIDIAKKVARRRGMKVKVYDSCSRIGRLRARLNRVNVTPTIIVGDKRITGDITEEKLSELSYP